MSKQKKTTEPPRYPERKWGPFHGGVGVAVWLNDTASMLGGVQFLVHDADPGYFVGVSFTYSAVFHDADIVDADLRTPLLTSNLHRLCDLCAEPDVVDHQAGRLLLPGLRVRERPVRAGDRLEQRVRAKVCRGTSRQGSSRRTRSEDHLR